MKTIKFKSEYFNPKDTLECGQVFRFIPFKQGYRVISLDKCCYLYEKNGFTYIETESPEYFENYFDLSRDYGEILKRIHAYNDGFLSSVAGAGKGIRILKQDKIETAFWFIISQNNNIARIKTIIEKLCKGLGEKREFMGEEYYTFPSIKTLASTPIDFYKQIGLGYRDGYLKGFALLIDGGLDFEGLSSLETKNLTKELLKIKGIGKKVADCITLFGFQRSDSFPVDTWIEKIYKQHFGGKEKDRKKISYELLNKYKDLSGYVQQYVFYYKRSLEKEGSLNFN